MRKATSAGEGGDIAVAACCSRAQWLAVSTDLGPTHRHRRAGRPGSSDQVPPSGGFDGDEGGGAVVVGTVKMLLSLAGTRWKWERSSSPQI
ncbi:hypothetical protein ACLOJK_015319 [Asimina triloba]